MYALLIALYMPYEYTSFLANDSLYSMIPQGKFLFLSLFFMFIVLAPGLSFLVMRMNGTITSLKMEQRKERYTPIAIMTFYCLVLYLFLIFQSESAFIPVLIKGMTLAGVLVSLSAYFITRFYKISLHAIGMGALTGFIYMLAQQLAAVPFYLIAILFLLSGLVMTARMILKSHTLGELGWGFALGFATQLICIYFYSLI
jgi:hypothetical protein